MSDAATHDAPAGGPSRDAARWAGVDRTVHPRDNMGIRDEARYLAVGAAAVDLVRSALALSGAGEPKKVLDFACGFGRVARHLRVAFSGSELVCADVWAEAADFVGRFADRAVRLDAAGSNWDEVGDGYGLIWCGSLLTHLPEDRARAVLDLFAERLAPGGVAVFTTHGRFARDRLASGAFSYGVADGAEMVAAFDAGRHGFAPYPGQDGYGASLTPTRTVIGWIEDRPGLTLRLACERAWDDHQDAVAFQRRDPSTAWVNLAANGR